MRADIEMGKLMYNNGRLQSELADAKAEIDRLRAIVAKLPTTADGVPVVPGMELWDKGHDVLEEDGTSYWEPTRRYYQRPHPFLLVAGKDEHSYSCPFDPRPMFSSREAAQAAAAATGKDAEDATQQ